MSFTLFDLHRDLLRGVEGMGCTVPTPIQKKAILWRWPARDALVCAVTGSGKTAAYPLPILHRFLAFTRTKHRADGPAGFLARRGVPSLREDYIHQVGRTAVADPTGAAYTFVSPGKESRLRTMQRARRPRIERAPLRGCRPGPLCG